MVKPKSQGCKRMSTGQGTSHGRAGGAGAVSVFPAALKWNISVWSQTVPTGRGGREQCTQIPAQWNPQPQLPSGPSRLGAALSFVRVAAGERLSWLLQRHSFGCGAHCLPGHNHLNSAKPVTRTPLFQSGGNGSIKF